MTDPQKNIQSVQDNQIINTSNNNKKFKILFIISAILLVLVLIVSILLFLQNKKLSNNNSKYFLVTKPTSTYQSLISPTNIIRQTSIPTSNSNNKNLISSAKSDQKNEKVIISAISNDNFINYYFDVNEKKLISKTANNNQTGFSLDTNFQSIQFTQDGKVFFSVSFDPKKSQQEGETYMVSKIYQSPNKLIFETDETKGEYFSSWKINKSGTKIYLIVSGKKSNSIDLYEISVDSGIKNKIITLEGVEFTDPLFLSSDETKLLVLKQKTRTENNHFYHDIYTIKIDLLTQKTTEKILWRDNGLTNWIYPTSLSFGPKLLKAVTACKEGENYTLRSFDVETGVTEDVYKIKGIGQTTKIIWSDDGTKITFGISEYGDNNNLPLDQGIVMYDYLSKKSTQLVKTDIVKQGTLEKNEASPILGSFNKNGLIYSVNTEFGKDLFYFDLNNMAAYKIDKSVDDWPNNIILFSQSTH